MKKKTFFLIAVWIVVSVLSVVLWFHFNRSQIVFPTIRVSSLSAVQIAQEYLQSTYALDLTGYRHAVIFAADYEADRFLHRVLSADEQKTFIKKHRFDLFFWRVRFFKELTKEEFRFSVSPEDGAILTFNHIVDDAYPSAMISQKEAETRAISFLKSQFSFDLSDYELDAQHEKKFDARIDYLFEWKRKDVRFRFESFSETPATDAKLTTSVIVRGSEISGFVKDALLIPENFNRFLEKQNQLGGNIHSFYQIFNLMMLAVSVFFLVIRRNDIVIHSVKNFYIKLVVFLALLSLVHLLIQVQSYLFFYPTTISFQNYAVQKIMDILLLAFYGPLLFLLPALLAESFYYELYPKSKEGSFLYYLRTTFFSKDVSKKIVIGYGLGVLLLSLQTLIFQMGYCFFGVWQEKQWLVSIVSSKVPWLTSFLLSFQSAVTEEIVFRVFIFCVFKKIFRFSFIAAFLASLMWGGGHSLHWIYPLWFRVFEVFLLGLLLAFYYSRYGLISTIVAHYVFNVMMSLPIFLNQQMPYEYSIAGIVLLSLPLILGVVAWLRNGKTLESNLVWRLNAKQLFNLEILRQYFKHNPPQSNSLDQLKLKLLSHGWDMGIVETALEELKSKDGSQLKSKENV